MSTIKEEARKTPDQLEREIDMRRENIVEKLNELGERLSPRRMVDQTVGYMRDNADSISRNVSHTISRNAGPATLAAAGLAAAGLWWMWRNSERHGMLDESHDFYGEYDFDVFDEYTDPSALDVAESTGASVMSEKGDAADAAEHARRKLESATLKARQKARQGRHALNRQSRKFSRGFGHAIEQQPLIFGAVGLAIGALISAGVAPTRTEDRLLGPARLRAKEKASDMARQFGRQAEETAREAGEKLQEDLKRILRPDNGSGLHPR